MAIQDIDFDGANNTEEVIDNNNNSDASTNEDDVTHLNGGDVDDITNTPENNNNDESNQVDENNNDNSSTGELTIGDQIEYEGVTYTIANNGDLVDENGNVFKEAKDVSKWLEENNIEDENDSFDINTLKEDFEVDFTDESGNEIEFDNTPDGIKKLY